MMPASSDSAPQDVAFMSCALATIFRGKLCETLLQNRPTVAFAKGSTIYDAGDGERDFFFIQRGIVKLSLIHI